MNGQLKIDSDTGITALQLTIFMMATGSLQIEKYLECGATQLDLTVMESGLTTTVKQMVHGLQI